MSTLTESQLSEWVMATFADGERHGLFRVLDSLPSTTLYKTGLAGSLLATIVNGRSTGAKFNTTSHPAEFEYDALVRHLRSLTHNEPAWCFYFQDHDNAYGELAQVWQWAPSYQLDQLQIFESLPANQSGAAHLGIVAESKTWMLLHHFYPHRSFEIVFYSNDSTTQDLLRALKMT